MNISGETKFFIGVILVTLVIIIGAVFAFSQPEKPVSTDLLIRNDSESTGSAQAKATLVEFSDFECPACITMFPLVKQLTEKYADNIKFVYRNFPLEQHKESKNAAFAAEAAGKQGKFWEMHDLLFKNQGKLQEEDIMKAGQELKLDMTKFDADRKSKEMADKIQQDINDATALKIDATPTFFLNNQKLKLNNPNDLEAAIKKVIGG